MKEEKQILLNKVLYRRNIIVWLFIPVFFLGCGTTYENQKPRMKLPQASDLVVVSFHGERDFIDYKVQFQGWESDYYQQAVFITDRATKKKSFAFAYVLPTRLVREIWGDKIPELYHFTPQQDGYINVDERTTALYLVFISPPHFWMFTPRAVVWAAGHIVKHRDFEKLVDKIAEVEPGILLSEKSQSIFAIAQKIAEDVRESLLPEKLTPRISPQDDSYDCVQSRTANIEAGGGNVKIKSKHMVFYGGGFVSGFDVSSSNSPVKHFVLNAQDGKVDLSIDNILSFNIINPEVETSVEIPNPKTADYGVRIEKGIELSTTIFTDSIKRIGLMANLGRAVKYAVEIAVPNIAACIPDGYTWGWAVVQIQDGLPLLNQCNKFLEDLFGVGRWEQIIGVLANQFLQSDTCVKGLMTIYRIITCGNNVGETIINQIAATLRWFPLVKIWDALTRYIPFGIELFTKPRRGVFFLRNGLVFGREIPSVVYYPQEVSSPGMMEVKILPYGCNRNNCTVRINCGDDKGLYVKSFTPTPPGACDLSLNLPIPVGFYGDQCIFSLIFSNDTEVFRKTIKIKNCPTCKPPSAAGGGGEEGGGCSSSSPVSLYYILAILILVLMRNTKRNEF